MTQALYAHMNNKTIKKTYKTLKKKKRRLLQSLGHGVCSFRGNGLVAVCTNPSWLG
jgi:hypothetical protein